MIPLFFEKSVYQKRRKILAESLVPNQDLIVFFTAPERLRNHDTEYPFRGDSSFIYLTGLAEPQAAFLLWREQAGKKIRTCFELFMMPRDRAKEQWNGYRYGVERADSVFGATKGFEISCLKERILNWLSQSCPRGIYPKILTNAGTYSESKQNLDRILESYEPPHRTGKMPVGNVEDIRPKVSFLRLIKEKSELDFMRKASKINVEAHLEAMWAIKPGMYEYEIQALVEGHYKKRGSESLAYNSICAGGANATILHYNFNSSKLKKDDLFLIDAGCEYHFYASDITRTLPVSGKYTDPQKQLMEIVSEAHSAAMKAAKPGSTIPKIHEVASLKLIEGLKDLGFLKGSTKDIYTKAAHKGYYPHGTGHWLGMDVHDSCPYLDAKGNPIKLAPGMVFTIEPGLYFMEDDKTVPKEWRGLGVRIEDDVVITSRGCEVLTEGLPRTASEIEKAMR